jgi:hypothetical protein
MAMSYVSFAKLMTSTRPGIFLEAVVFFGRGLMILVAAASNLCLQIGRVIFLNHFHAFPTIIGDPIEAGAFEERRQRMCGKGIACEWPANQIPVSNQSGHQRCRLLYV